MTTVECIHGLDAQFCDICNPRPEPTASRASAARPAREVRVTSQGRTGAVARPPAARRSSVPRERAAAPLPSVDLRTQRGYHVTHLDNLAAILGDGAVRAGAVPAVDLSSGATRELRAATELPGGGTVADRVPFYLTPEATRWAELRDGATGPTWSEAARGVRGVELVALAVPLPALGQDAIIAAGDAAATLTRFTVVGDDAAAATTALRRLHAEDGGLPDAELLGGAEVPFASVALVIVANEPVRDRVRGLLSAAGLATKVAVNPPWFASA